MQAPSSIFSRHSNFTFSDLFSVCHLILTSYPHDKESVSWINDIEPGRLLDALRLYLCLTTHAKSLLGPKRYRSEHATLIARWLRLNGNKAQCSMSTGALKSAERIFGKKTPREVADEVISGNDPQRINADAGDIFRYIPLFSVLPANVEHLLFVTLILSMIRILPCTMYSCICFPHQLTNCRTNYSVLNRL